MKDDSLRRIFANPGSEYRGKPFWAWNGKLEEGELRRQIRVFKRMGLGGAFMHSRVGLATDYLSEEWFALVAACADEARKNGMEAWLYDEDRWPSGAAGGIVTRKKKFRHKNLVVNVIDAGAGRLKGVVAKFAAVLTDGLELASYRNLVGDCKAAKGEATLVFTVEDDEESPWYNGQTYLDTLSKDAVAEFIKVTHEAYRRNNGKDFGKLIPGIFTDEPNYGGSHFDTGRKRGFVPWTVSLPKTFKSRYGYDISGFLPELFFAKRGEEFSKVRRDYRDCLCHLFCVNFSKQIFDWCEKNGIAYTGHVLEEPTLLSQTKVVGAAMRSYEYMQAPGIDILTAQGVEGKKGWRCEFTTAKQCSSVLDQFARKWMLSELYGCTGWDFSLADGKVCGDWQAALGVNLRCQHLAWYTMLGEAKRDYPASIFYQSPWWKDYSILEDYFARVHTLTTQGKAVRDVAVVHPIETAWGIYAPAGGTEGKVGKYDEKFASLTEILLEEHYDFDFLDEDLLARHGSAAGGELKLMNGSYRVVVIPPMETMRSSTLKLLAKFAASGGEVIYAGEPPALIDSEKIAEGISSVVKGAVKVAFGRKEISGALSKISRIRRVSIRDAEGNEYGKCFYMLRHDAKSGKSVVFVCHRTNQASSGKLTVDIPFPGKAQEWDPSSGQISAVEQTVDGSRTLISTEFLPCGSRLFVIGQAPVAVRPADPVKIVRKTRIGGLEFPVLRDEPNAFPLDMPEFSIDGGGWRGPLEILQIDRAVRDVIGIPHRGGAMVQPWARSQGKKPAKSADLNLRYVFDVEQIPGGPCFLVLEEPWKYEISLNGNPVGTSDDDGWWIDPAMRKIAVDPAMLVEGRNELLAATRHDSDSGLESVFFAGEFGVRWKGSTAQVSAVPATLKLGDWGPQGLACYSGSVTYLCDAEVHKVSGERIFLEVPEWRGSLLNIHVNGRSGPRIAWPPYECDITDILREGMNRIGIEVVSSRRNLFGPLHKKTAGAWTGPWEFQAQDDWTDSYVSVPCGLIGGPALSWRKEQTVGR